MSSRRVVLTSAISTAAAMLGTQTAVATSPAALATRFSFAPTITVLPPLGALSSFEDELSTPRGASTPSVRMRFVYPTQWSQIDRALGGITLVDGNTGLKLYVLKSPLPTAETLASVPKVWFAESIFEPQGALAKAGTTVEEFKVSSTKMIEPREGAAPTRRRLGLKYTVVTGNQKTVERRAVVDAYEVDGVAYMLLASATATKWEASEKERCEKAADSFFIG